MPIESLWKHPDFLKLWTGQTVSQLGSVVTRTALPLVALLVLGAGPLELAILVISASLAVLLVGLVAGAWVDRLRRRPIHRVVEANSKLATSSSIGEIGGPGSAGALVQIAGAPFAMLVDAISFVVSAISLAAIRFPEPPRPARAVDTRIGHEIAEGLRLVRRHSILVPLAARSVLAHLFGAFYGVLYSIYLLHELHLDPLLLGIVISAGGVGSLVASLFASRVVRAFGIGPAIIWMASGASILGILTPLAQGPVAVATLMVFLPQLIGDGLQTIEGVGERSLIQGLIPDAVLGRVNATLEVISHGVGYPVGALVAAFVAEQVGVRGAIALGWAGMAASILFLVFSPLPHVRTAAEWRPAP